MILRVYECIKENGGVGYRGKGYKKGDGQVLKVEPWKEKTREFQGIRRWFRFLYEESPQPVIIAPSEPQNLTIADVKKSAKRKKAVVGIPPAAPKIQLEEEKSEASDGPVNDEAGEAMKEETEI